MTGVQTCALPIFLFARATEEQGRFKAKVIGDEIAHRLFGETDNAKANAITVKTLVYQLDGTIGLEDADDGTLLDRLFAQAHDRFDEHVSPSPSPAARIEEPGDDSPRFKLVYRPIWNVRKAMVSGFLATLWEDKSERSEEHTSELQSHSFISYAVFCLKKKKLITKFISSLP